MNENEPSISLSLTVKNSADALDFYTRAFGAKELFRMPLPGDAGIAHAEFMIGNTRIFMSDESEDWHAFAMPEGTKASCLFSIATPDCNASHKQAVDAGATALTEPEDQFWGARSSVLLDPFGYRWSVCQMIEEVSPEELKRRATELFGG